jgi:ABC-type lipoprotein release transport system permease subunit
MAGRLRHLRSRHASVLLIVFVLLGVAITVGTVVLIVVPVAVGLAILASLFRSPNTR